LTGAVLHEKKWKLGNAMDLYDPDEKEGQALFFSPAKIARVRQRVADEEQAEHQRKQIVSDKKLQAAITRDEKALEAEEKKIARTLTRQAARELLAQEKAERQAVRQAQRAQKAADTAKRKQDVAEAKAQRVRPKNTAQKSARSMKRSLDVGESERPKKRRRTRASLSRFAIKSNDSTDLSDIVVVLLSDDTLSTIDSTKSSNSMRNAKRGTISLPLRSGRNTRLPARFQ
jgi:membrane protein involved in colicin uptake